MLTTVCDYHMSNFQKASAYGYSLLSGALVTTAFRLRRLRQEGTALQVWV
jgi:hypothetical protein